jgi:hypothetical protein
MTLTRQCLFRTTCSNWSFLTTRWRSFLIWMSWSFSWSFSACTKIYTSPFLSSKWISLKPLPPLLLLDLRVLLVFSCGSG